jgi:hypothetical protein
VARPAEEVAETLRDLEALLGPSPAIEAVEKRLPGIAARMGAPTGFQSPGEDAVPHFSLSIIRTLRHDPLDFPREPSGGTPNACLSFLKIQEESKTERVGPEETDMVAVKAGSRDGRPMVPTRQTMVGLLAIAAVLAIAPSADALDDVRGWQNTNWGMTELEVKRSLESLGLPLTALPPPNNRLLGADAPFKTTVEIAGDHYDAIFLFSADTHQLGRVLLRTVDFSRSHALKLHNSLLRALTEQYGRPGETESQGSAASLTKWAFKTTTVVLSMYTDMAMPGNHVTHVAVVYAPTPTASTDPMHTLMGLGLLQALREIGRNSR